MDFVADTRELARGHLAQPAFGAVSAGFAPKDARPVMLHDDDIDVDIDDDAFQASPFLTRRQRFSRLLAAVVLLACSAIGVLALLAPRQGESAPAVRASTVLTAPVTRPSEPAPTTSSVLAPPPAPSNKDAHGHASAKLGRAGMIKPLGGR